RDQLFDALGTTKVRGRMVLEKRILFPALSMRRSLTRGCFTFTGPTPAVSHAREGDRSGQPCDDHFRHGRARAARCTRRPQFGRFGPGVVERQFGGSPSARPSVNSLAKTAG